MATIHNPTRRNLQEDRVYHARERYSRFPEGKKIFLLLLIGVIVVLFSPAALQSSPSANLAAAHKTSRFADISEEITNRTVLAEEYSEKDVPPLYNSTRYVPADYLPELISVGYNPARQEQLMETKAGEAFLAMRADAAAEGISIVPLSGYRSHQEQITIYNLGIQYYLAQGYSHEQAIKETQFHHSPPGTSEHEAGLAVDVNMLEEGFEDTAEFSWLQQNAANYGFILRYPKNKIAVTKVFYEPWHYRYVGSNHAAEIVKRQISLEEYLKL